MPGISYLAACQISLEPGILPTLRCAGVPAASHTWPKPVPDRGLILEAGLDSRAGSGPHAKGSMEMAAVSLSQPQAGAADLPSPPHPVLGLTSPSPHCTGGHSPPHCKQL